MTNMIKTEETLWNLRHYQKVEEVSVLTPETEMVVSVISVGYIKENPPKPKRKDVDDILKFFQCVIYNLK